MDNNKTLDFVCENVEKDRRGRNTIFVCNMCIFQNIAKKMYIYIAISLICLKRKNDLYSMQQRQTASFGVPTVELYFSYLFQALHVQHVQSCLLQFNVKISFVSVELPSNSQPQTQTQQFYGKFMDFHLLSMNMY